MSAAFAPRLLRPAVAAGLLLTIFVLLEIGSLRHLTHTPDEGGHYGYGWRILNFDAKRYRDDSWVRENFEPVGHVAHGHLIFQVTPEALRRISDPLSADWKDKDA